MAAVTSREERIAKNESVVREMNEKIEEAHDDGAPPEHVRMLCECGNQDCDRVVAITLAEYERVRQDPRHFAIIREHLISDAEQVVWETDRFVVVEKNDGTPAEVAIEEDPRS
jgi:hypothetical protein